MEQVYSFEPIVDHEAKVLILGSMPGVDSLKKLEYYGHHRNHFWPIIFSIFNCPMVENYDDKIRFLQKHGIALWDVIQTCKRKGSLDSKIKEEVPNDFGPFLLKYSNIEWIIFNGSKAETTFKKMVLKKNVIDIEMFRAPSTSPIPTQKYKNFEEKVAEWRRIFDCSLLKTR